MVGQFIVLASTTSVDNSGLLKQILPLFEKASGIDVRVVALGTGQALDAARRGEADLVLVHDPEAEQKFIDEGHGINRREIAWNDFVIVGPAADPAKIRELQDVVSAFKAIWDARAPFVTRGDNSGTHALENRLWDTAGLDISGAGAWYRDIRGNMVAALGAAAGTGGYTLSDRGTWLSFDKRRDLAILFEEDPRLLNRYNVIELNPKRHPKAKLALAKQLAQWLSSSAGQRVIGNYEVARERLFHPEAYPKPWGRVLKRSRF